MNNERLSDLGVLSMESKRAKALDMDEFVRLFSSKHGNPQDSCFEVSAPPMSGTILYGYFEVVIVVSLN